MGYKTVVWFDENSSGPRWQKTTEFEVVPYPDTIVVVSGLMFKVLLLQVCETGMPQGSLAVKVSPAGKEHLPQLVQRGWQTSK